MVNLTLKFAACLRAIDMKVSTAEVLDCVNHLKLIDVIDEDLFKTVLKTNFAKSRRDHRTFDHAYDLFFHQMNSNIRLEDIKANENLVAANEIDILQKECVDQLAANLEMDQINQALINFLSGEPLTYMKMLRELQTKIEVARVINSNLGQLTERLQIMLKINAIRNLIPQFSGGNFDMPGSNKQKRLNQRLEERLDNAYQLLVKEPVPENESLNVVTRNQKRSQKLGDIPFANLSQTQIEEMRETIRQLVRKLNDIVTLRFASRNKGILDIKKTLRKSAKYHGLPLELKFRNKPLRKGKIVALCDVSSSVWSAARFMLNMLYSLQDCFSKVKSYIFVAQVADVTDFFDRYDTNDAVEKILNEADIEYNVLTDYGATLLDFKTNYMNVLDKKTTLIIIGDGRSNYLNPREHILQDMREKVRRIIWLTPEPEKFWRTGDSQIMTYKTYCHELRVCRNLNQLNEFIEELVI
ncbi:MAG: VWA domain-containing protein [Proteobacteria bacterium]|nr:VWA domain-containing protein [Pseudomonadota bacterium]